MQTERAYMGRHDEDRRRRRGLVAWWRGLSRGGMIATVVLGLVVLGAAVAIAAILLRAEVTGGGTTGTAVEFEWGVTADGGLTTSDNGSLTTQYMVDTDSDGVWDSSQPIPAPLVCTIDVVAGELQVAMTGGWLPGEACGLIAGGDASTAYLRNPSSVDVDVIQWDFGTSDLGLDGSGAYVEVILGDRATGTLYDADGALPAQVLAGASESVGVLIFQLDTLAPFSTPFVFDTAAVIGETTR